MQINVDELEKIEDNFDSYGADKPNILAIRRAKNFEYLLDTNLEFLSVDPDAMGGVTCTTEFGHPDRSVYPEKELEDEFEAEITFLNSGKNVFILSNHGKVIITGNFQIKD